MLKKIVIYFLLTLVLCSHALAEDIQKSVTQAMRDQLLAEFKARKVKSPLEIPVTGATDTVVTLPGAKTQLGASEKASVEVDAPIDSVNSSDTVDANSVLSQQQQWIRFPETSLWTGAYINPRHDTGGVWFNLKYLQWYTKNEKPENFGIGFNIRGDYGKLLKNSNADWGYLALGPEVGYYRELDRKTSFMGDVGLLYRFDKNRQNGLMPTLHAEVTRNLDYANDLIFQVDASYFPGDSWVGPGIYWEHELNEDWKVISGAGLSFSFLDGDSFTGFMPSVRLKYHDFSFGLNANLFTGFGPFYGAVASYELESESDAWYKAKKENSVILREVGTFNNNESQLSQKAIE